MVNPPRDPHRLRFLRHPFRTLSQTRRLVLSLALFMVGLVIHRRQSVEAETDQAPQGTLSFPLSDDAAEAQSSFSFTLPAVWR